MTARAAVVVVVLGALAAVAAPARADTATFAVVVGVNRSVDADLPALRYADDDAVLYQALFQQLGATVYLLARPDDNTRRLHPRAAADARPPVAAALDRTIAEVVSAVAQARARGQATRFYFVYAGHGNIRDGQGYISLEDDRLTAADLERRVVDAVPAGEIHLIVDACYSGLLAGARGPGGERRPLRGFSQFRGLADDDRIGLLLSTSSARESHEWEGFQAGVFSYEVRSGLYGAADADGDGQVSYDEIAAFVTRANAAIPNERFRPDLYARRPRGTGTVVDLRDALHRRFEITGSRSGHYVLEDERGVRLVEFHNGVAQNVAMIRPASAGALFLRRVDSDQEYRVPDDSGDVLTIDGLVPDRPQTTTRGAAHASFSLTFSLAFDEDVVRALAQPVRAEPTTEPPPRDGRGPARWVAFGVGGAALATGVAFLLSAQALRDGATQGESQASAADRNAQIETRNTVTAVCAGVAGAALVTGAVLTLWPRSQPAALPALSSTADRGVVVGVRGSF
ncbi:MAG TPA: hypothetical protein VHW23_00010 [Kofleriaceae bacterium]|jgi:hypothetical protein|nr:hypothetical protein [Kofleriaceae bacterium]